MLKQIKKKKVKVKLPESVTEQIACGACGRVREETARVPEWQCPGCGAAYNKVNHKPDEKRYTQNQLEKKNLEDFKGTQQKHELSQQAKAKIIKTGFATGSMALVYGMERTVTACSGLQTLVPSNPWLKLAGAVILAGTLAYTLFKYLM